MSFLMSRLHRSHAPTAGLLSLVFSVVVGCAAADPPNSTGAGGQPSAGTGGQVTGQAGNAGAGPAGTGGQITGEGGSAGSGPAGEGGSSPTGVAGNGPAGTTGSGAAGSAGGGAAGRGGGPAGAGGSGQSAGRGGTGASAGAPGGTGGTTPVAEPKLITSAQNNYWKTGTLTEVTTGTDRRHRQRHRRPQNWDGMGGTFNEAGWNVLMMLTAAERDRAIKLLFDATDGARFQYGRIPIGASDYAMSRYTLNETAGDTAMNSFSIERDKQYLIPYIKAALAIKPDINLWASPWTPPTWMKSQTTPSTAAA